MPTYLPKEVIADGGVIAVHLWSSVSPIPPVDRIACARALGFWTTPLVPGELRIGPFMMWQEKALPSSTIYYRQALVQTLDALRAARKAQLLQWGWYGRDAPPASDPEVEALLAPYRNASFAPFAKLQPYGHGRWPNGTMANHVPHHRTSDEVWVRPGGKCAAGMWVSKNEETPDAASLPSGIARPARAELS